MTEAEKASVSLSCFRPNTNALHHQPIPLRRGKVRRAHKLSA